jgi:hypothetical protein
MFGADWCMYGAVCAVFIKYSAVLSSILLFGADWSDYGAVFIKYSVVSSSKVLIGASMVLFVLSLSNIVLFYQVYCCLVPSWLMLLLFFQMSTSHSSDEGQSDDGIESALMEARRRRRRRNTQIMFHVLSHSEKHLEKKPRMKPRYTGQQWVFDCLGNSKDCYDMFRMHRPCFDSLHDTLVQKYGLEGSSKMCSEEALGMFLWTLGSPQSVSQVHKRFKRSKETINRKFAEVLYCVNQLAGDIIKPNLLIHSSQLCTRDYGTLDSHLILMVQLVLSMGHTYRLLCQLLLWSTMLAALDIPHRMLWLCVILTCGSPP